MGFDGADYTADDSDDIYERTSEALTDEYDGDVEPSPYSLVQSLLLAQAQTRSSNQEAALEALNDDAYLVTATGEALDRKASEVNVQRRPATRATGVVRFSRSTPATTDYQIPSGTTVQTESGDVQFLTDDPTTIAGPIDDTDITDYTTSSTSYVAKTTFTVDVTYRETLDVAATLRSSNNSYTASVEIADTTNSTTIDTFTTTNTSNTSKGPTEYNVANKTGDVTVEYRLKISDSSGTATLAESTVTKGGQTATEVNVREVEGGADGNLSADRLVSMPSFPTGVNKVTNDEPTGDDAYTDTDGDPLVIGRPEETDDELRERTQETKSIGGAATHDAIEAKLRARDTVVGLTVNVNKDNTSQNGLPAHSFEPVVYAPSATDEEIATDIFEVKAVTDHDVGGVNGTEHTYTVASDMLATGEETIHFSRAPNIALDIEIEVVYTDDYVGSDGIKDRIVKYVGGTDTDGVRRIGLSIGEDVLVPLLRDAVVGADDTGVLGVPNLTIDSDGDGNDNTTTNSDGIDELTVASNEVATVDAANITVTEDPAD